MRVLLVIWFCAVAGAVYCAPTKGPTLVRLSQDLKDARTQAEMNAASAKIADYWDECLLAIERKIEAKLGADERKKFSESKARWRTYLSEEVEFRAHFFEGGTMQPLSACSHRAMLTEHRVAELEALFTDALAEVADVR